jgi:hypothetical protein
VFGGENLVKIVYFSTIEALVGIAHLFQLGIAIVCVMNNFNLVVAVDLYFANVVPVFEIEERPNSHGDFDPGASSEAFAALTPGTSLALVIGGEH